MNVTRLFILRPVATLLLSASVMLLGLLGYNLLPIAPLPNISIPTIVITATLTGASPQTMAATVATPLERSLGQIAGITEMTSSSSQGSTSIVLQFDLSRDINGAGRDVQAAINAARALLPSSMHSLPTYREINPSAAPILVMALTSQTVPMGELYNLASSDLEQRIAQIDGVGEVDVRGGALPAVRVDLQPAKLYQAGIALDTVREVLANTTLNGPKGILRAKDGTYYIDANDQISHAVQYQDLVVGYHDGLAVHLKDVARVTDSIQDIYVSGYLNGKPAVLLTVSLQSGANILRTIQAIDDTTPQLQAMLPPGVQLVRTIDRSGTIAESLHETLTTLLIAVLLVIAVVYIFLRDWRATLIPALALPISLIGTCAVIYLFGFSLDNLSLMAMIIATGFVVDDAIVVLENIVRHREMGRAPLYAALIGSREVIFTVVSMTLSLIAVFIPLLLLGGLIGRLFREFAVTLSVALVISMLVSLTLTPMLCAYVLGRQDHNKPQGRIKRGIEHFLERMNAVYMRALASVMANKLLTMFGLLLVIILNLYMYSTVQKGFFPDQDTGVIFGAIRADQNISFQAFKPMMLKIMDNIEHNPNVQYVMVSTGDGRFGARNNASLFIGLKDYSQRKMSATDIANALSAQNSKDAGVQAFMMAAQDLRIGGRSGNGTYQFSLHGDDLALLNTWNDKVTAGLKTLPELTTVNSDQQAGGQEVMLQIDRDAARRLGVSVENLDDLLNDAFSQRSVATIYQTLNQYYVIMEVDPRYAQDPSVLNNSYIVTTSGARVPLSAFVQIKSGTAPLSVAHQNVSATSTISFNLADGVALDRAQAAIAQEMVKLNVPPQIQYGYGGTAQAFQQLAQSMPWLILAALLAVYIVLGVLYESYVHPLTIISTLPSAGLGALLLLMITRSQLTIIALIGIILLIGIVKKNAIMLIDFALICQRERGMKSEDAIMEACKMRLRPILMTTLAAFFGALPLAVSSSGDAGLRQPLGIAIVGGLAVSQLLTLFTTPVVYVYLDRASQRTRAFWRRHVRGETHPSL